VLWNLLLLLVFFHESSSPRPLKRTLLRHRMYFYRYRLLPIVRICSSVWRRISTTASMYWIQHVHVPIWSSVSINPLAVPHTHNYFSGCTGPVALHIFSSSLSTNTRRFPLTVTCRQILPAGTLKAAAIFDFFLGESNAESSTHSIWYRQSDE